MNRSAILAMASVVAIIASAIWLMARPPTSATRAVRSVGWRECTSCGYRWHMSASELIEEQKKNKSPWVRCPKCGKLRGVGTMICPECGKRISLYEEVVGDDGGKYLRPRVCCPHCGAGSRAPSEGPEEEPYLWREDPETYQIEEAPAEV